MNKNILWIVGIVAVILVASSSIPSEGQEELVDAGDNPLLDTSQAVFKGMQGTWRNIYACEQFGTPKDIYFTNVAALFKVKAFFPRGSKQYIGMDIDDDEVIPKLYSDTCVGSTSVRQYYCKNEKVYSSTSRCPKGTSCNQGMCTTLTNTCIPGSLKCEPKGRVGATYLQCLHVGNGKYEWGVPLGSGQTNFDAATSQLRQMNCPGYLPGNIR